MPATEQTWYNQKRLHLVFGLSSLVLLVATIWMFVADHNRPWKAYQITMRNVDLKLNSMRKLQAENERVRAEQERIERELEDARRRGYPQGLMRGFQAEVEGFLQEVGRGQDESGRDLGPLQYEADLPAYEATRKEILRRDLLAAALRFGEQFPPAKSTAEGLEVIDDEQTQQWLAGLSDRRESYLEQLTVAGDALGKRLSEAQAVAAAVDKKMAEAESAADGSPLKDAAAPLAEIKTMVDEQVARMDRAVQRHQEQAAAAQAAAKLDPGGEPVATIPGYEALDAALGPNRAVLKQWGVIAPLVQSLGKPGESITELLKTAAKNWEAHVEQLKKSAEEMRSQYDSLALPRLRSKLEGQIDGILKKVKFVEDRALQQKKFTAAKLDAKRAELGLAVRDNLEEKYGPLQDEVDAIKAKVDQLGLTVEDATQHRKQLEGFRRAMMQPITDLEKALADNQADVERLKTAQEQRRSSYFEFVNGVVPVPGKRWLELPILDAFNSQLKIDNLWSDGLTQDYNFRDVRRFDRCTTCHQAMQKTMPGSATEPAYVQERFVDLVLAAPQPGAGGGESEADAADAEVEATEAQAAGDDADPDADAPAKPSEIEIAERRLAEVYGLKLDDEGLLYSTDVAVSLVEPKSLAAQAALVVPPKRQQPQDIESIQNMMAQPPVADGDEPRPGLMVGDVIDQINGDSITGRDKILFRLLDAADKGESLRITVRRGLPQPYTSHPRLDLFVGSLSPHKMSTFACTVCHDGQGSATGFKWASHTPNDPAERKRWENEHGWFDNHHWIYPMHAKRFQESACLKCHHEVTELLPSAKFPDPPAPKVTRGHDLISKYGCFGCHEVNGYDGADRIGPDLRLEPNFFAAAAQLKTDSGFANATPVEQGWVKRLIQHPEDSAVRHGLVQMLERDKAAEEPRFSSDAHGRLLPLLKDVDNPGKLRKVGPSLRHIAAKDDTTFLYDWIREPANFRPSTRMPQFFGLWKHLEGEPEQKEKSERLEPLEIYSMVVYLQKRSQPYQFVKPPEGIAESTVEEQVARGKQLFNERGCLTCHSHRDFPNVADFRPADKIQQGPDLSQLAKKFAADRNPEGPQWLYSWLKDPTGYNPRTLMPDMKLDPVEVQVGDEKRLIDPAADIVAYLLAEAADDEAADDEAADDEAGHMAGHEWKPAAVPDVKDPAVVDALDEIVKEYLGDAFFQQEVKQYLQRGIPEGKRESLKVAERELIVSDDAFNDSEKTLSTDQKLLYLGRKTIARYGCYACHDIPGFEDAKPIGAALADWGRKEPAKLAFEHIHQYLHHAHGHGGHGAGEHADGEHADGEHEGDAAEHPASESAGGGETSVDGTRLIGDTAALPPFYEDQLNAGNRIGFIYQKLREPRSYDYHKTRNKKYSERLRMPMFPFGDGEREAVITFVLGLVADPPTEKYVYQPAGEREQALLDGRRVLEKYNCSGCHMLEAEQWELEFADGELRRQPSGVDFPFVLPEVGPEELAASDQPNDRNRIVATAHGTPAVRADGRPWIQGYDAEFDELYDLEPDEKASPVDLVYYFDFWKPAAIDGEVYRVGAPPLPIRGKFIRKRRPSYGGDFTRYVIPYVVEKEQEVNPNANGAEAWGWLPPPLIGQGAKVQTDWLHEFLLEPYPIRPAVVLRMPKFNMSSDEAAKLVNYFAARDNQEYPYEFNQRQQQSHLRQLNQAYKQQEGVVPSEPGQASERLRDAMQIVTSNNYCVKCHLVGDYDPTSSDRAKAPNLADIHRRMRSDYLKRWIANPKTILPYTGMPVNVSYDPDKPNLGTTVPQDVYHGDSLQQVDALVDLLMNYNLYAQERSQISPLVKPATQAAEPTEAADAAADESGE